MKEFEVGKTYRVQGLKGETITITKRTKCFVTFTGSYEGRKKTGRYFENGLFGLGENILIDLPGKPYGLFVHAAWEV
jgi:hypothetical protein